MKLRLFQMAWANPKPHERIAVLRRDGTGAPRWFDADPFFLFHIMNAHEEDGAGRIAVDYVQHGAFLAPGAALVLDVRLRVTRGMG